MFSKRFGRGSIRRKFSLEHLESRSMLAGDVTAVNSGGNLIVRGNNADNQVAIVQLDAGQYAVVGLNGTNITGFNTTVGSNEAKVVSGITGNIDVDLKKGNDSLIVGNDAAGLVDLSTTLGFDATLGDTTSLTTDFDAYLSTAPAQFSVPRHLIVRMGDGDDNVGIIADVGLRIDADLGKGDNAFGVDPSFVGDDIILRAGKGKDNVLIEDTTIAQMLDVNLGDGDNYFEVAASSIGESAVVNTGKGSDYIEFTEDTAITLNLIVRSNNGNDTVEAGNSDEGGITVGQTVDLDTGSGNDGVESVAGVGRTLKINTGSGNDGVEVANTTVGDDLLIDTGSGNDNDSETVGSVTTFGDFSTAGGVTLDTIDVTDNFEAHLGSGIDTLVATTVTVGHDALIDAGSGDDNVSVDASSVDHFFTALMGSGNNDVLSITTSTAVKAILRGGSGNNDTLETDLDPNNPPPGMTIDIKEFENVI